MNHNADAVSDLAARLRELRPAYPEGRFAGRGIVVAAGGTTLFTNAWVLVTILRRTLNCRLPIEIWHFGAAEMSPYMASMLRELDVTVVDAVARTAAAGVRIRDGWQLKSFCLLDSGFAEVLLLDADQVPVRDPAELFDWPEYRQTGAVFWPDIVGIKRSSPVWEQMALPPPDREFSLETGQLLVDKSRHWRGLSIALGLNEAAEIIYRLVYGDKDTFLLAWMLAGEEYSLVPHRPFCGDRCLIQRDFAGQALFQHRTNGKWSYGADERPTENFQLFADCVAALAELRRRWNGRVFHAPDRPISARLREAELAGIGFRLEIVGRETEGLHLMAFGEIGQGRSPLRQNWWCEEMDGRIALLIRDGHRTSYRFTAADDGTWSGHLLLPVPVEATLRPALTAGTSEQDLSRPGVADMLLEAIGYPLETAQMWERHGALLERLALGDMGVRERLRHLAERSAPGSALPALVARLDELSRQEKLGSLDPFLTNYRFLVGQASEHG